MCQPESGTTVLVGQPQYVYVSFLFRKIYSSSSSKEELNSLKNDDFLVCKKTITNFVVVLNLCKDIVIFTDGSHVQEGNITNLCVTKWSFIFANQTNS
jgi:hypothetical protein